MVDEGNAIKAIFAEALKKVGVAERAVCLDEACAGNPALRDRVDALLEVQDRVDRLLEQPAAQPIWSEGAETRDDEALDFLSPSHKPGSLGRLGHYEVLAVLGRGGMGIVMRGFDEKLHRVVALKVLAPALASNKSARQRFVREARAAAAVTHENVIDIHAVEDAGPIPYLVMQCVDGKTLQRKLEDSGPLELRAILRIGLQMAEGLAAAHRQGLIHRDIKPANILLENGIERVKITDFGLARAVDDSSLTQSGYVAGTPLYMSPEQARGERVDHRSDLFSLGSVLYALCTGEAPFQAENSMAVLKRVCDEEPLPLREVMAGIPAWLEDLIAKLHAKKPEDRFASASEVAALLSQRLARLQADGSSSVIEASPAKLRSPRRRPNSRLRTIAGLSAAAVAVAALSLAGWFAYQSWFADEQEAKAPGATNLAASPPALPVELKKSRPLLQHSHGVRTLAFSPDGATLASGGLDRHIYLWDTKTWQVRGPLEGHAGEISALAFSPDGARLASVSSTHDSALVRVWEVATSRQVATLGDGGQGMWDVAYSPDGRTLACGGWDKQLHLMDVATGTERLVIPDVATRLVRGLSFSPDGGQIAAGGGGPTRLWDTTTGQQITTNVPLHDEMCPTLLPGGKALAAWTYAAGRITICELPSGQVRAAWRAHPQTIEALAVSRDGRFLASVGNDGLAHVWSTADQTKVATLIGHQGTIFSVAFTPDGSGLATGGSDDLTIRIWDLPEVCRVAR